MFFLVVDEWFLDKFERFSNRMQRTFGITCFSLARACLGITPIIFAIPLVLGESNFQGFMALFLALLLVSAFFLLGTYICEKIVFEFSLQGLANPFKFYLRLRRFIYLLAGNLLMALFPMSDVFSTLGFEAWILILIVHFYFLSCDPLPPGKSKVRALIEKIRESLSPQPEPVSQES